MGRSSDFMFWQQESHLTHKDPENHEVEFNLPIQDNLGAHTPLFWPSTPTNHFRQETSCFSPRNRRHYKCLSPSSRSRAIRDGKRELMEMIEKVPESEYEISLKDMVDEEKIEQVVVEEKKEKGKMGNRVIPQKSWQMQRTESMETEVFLLKMFLPMSLSFNKKPKVRKQLESRPAQSQSQTSEGSDKQANKDWWKSISVAVKENRISTIINSNQAREKKRKPGGQRGCLF